MNTKSLIWHSTFAAVQVGSLLPRSSYVRTGEYCERYRGVWFRPGRLKPDYLAKVQAFANGPRDHL